MVTSAAVTSDSGYTPIKTECNQRTHNADIRTYTNMGRGDCRDCAEVEKSALDTVD
jgi:hypothetical protein